MTIGGYKRLGKCSKSLVGHHITRGRGTTSEPLNHIRLNRRVPNMPCISALIRGERVSMDLLDLLIR